MFDIHVNNNYNKVDISTEDLKEAAMEIFKKAELEQEGELSITLTDDEEITRLNKQYRNLDRPTDVLSFAMDEGMETPAPDDPDYSPLIGDVIISIPTAQRQAEEMGHSLAKEIMVLLVHGILHLFGYDHDNIYQQAFMKEEEKAILESLKDRERSLVKSPA